MLLVINTISSDEYFNADYDYAVCMLEDRAAKILAGYVALFNFMKKSQPELVEMVFEDTDAECDFFTGTIFDGSDTYGDKRAELLPVNAKEELKKKGWSILPEDYHPGFSPRDAHVPAESSIIICEDGFYWRAWPQDSTTNIVTETVSADILSQII